MKKGEVCMLDEENYMEEEKNKERIKKGGEAEYEK